MDIKEKLTQQDKAQIVTLNLECQVLNNLLNQRKAMLGEVVQQSLTRAGLSPQLYNLRFNTPEDKWEAELKEGALVIPNRETRRALERNKN